MVQGLKLADVVRVAAHVRDIHQIALFELELEPEAVLLRPRCRFEHAPAPEIDALGIERVAFPGERVAEQHLRRLVELRFLSAEFDQLRGI